MSRFSIFPFSCVTAGPTNLHLPQLENYGLQMNSQLASLIPGGALDVSVSHLANAAPALSLQTRDLLTIMNAVGPSSVLPFTAGVGRLQKRTDTGFLTGSDHEVYDIAKGTLVPMSITGSQEDTEGATLIVNAVILDDGVNRPIVRQTGQSLASAPAPAFVSRYYMAPAFIDTVQIPNLVRSSIEFGINYNAKGFNGSTFPTEGAIIARRPKFKFTTTDASVDAAVDSFLRVLGGEIRSFFQASVDGSDRIAAGTTAHIKISATGGTWNTEDVTAQNEEDGTVTVSVTPNSILSVSTGSAIA